MAPHPTRRRTLRTAIATTTLALAAALAPIGPAPSPAGAWGGTGTGGVGCGATGRWGSAAVATTSGSTCGSNWVRWRFIWGPGTWMSSTGGSVSIVEDPNLYAGGGGHRACGGCTIVNT